MNETRRFWSVVVLVIVLIAAAGGAIPALQRQAFMSARKGCQTTERRLATALLLYSQDYNGCLPPAEYTVATGEWRTWVTALSPYLSPQQTLVCPVNPVDKARNPFYDYPVRSSYALNVRFFGLFAPGPFPIENLEIPARTALLVEGGQHRADPLTDSPTYPWAMAWYWDTAWWPNVYPSPHAGRMNVAAADGHVVNLRVLYYQPDDDHDALYGRLGGAIYNWNGGFPNGQTEGPPRE